MLMQSRLVGYLVVHLGCRVVHLLNHSSRKQPLCTPPWWLSSYAALATPYVLRLLVNHGPFTRAKEQCRIRDTWWLRADFSSASWLVHVLSNNARGGPCLTRTVLLQGYPRSRATAPRYIYPFKEITARFAAN